MKMQHTTRQRGVAVVEFALILPMILIMTFIVIEMGRAVMEYNTMTKSLRDAARYLSLQTPGTKITEAKNLVVYGDPTPDGSAPPLLPGLDISKVSTPTWQPQGTDPIITVVSIQVSGYTFEPIISSAFGLDIGAITFAPITASMRSHL